MKQLIENTFPCQTGKCIEIRNEAIFWIDEYLEDVDNFERLRGKSFVIIETDNELLFTVRNPSHKDVHFLAIDYGIFKDTKEYAGGRCDFALFDDKRFCFIESKNATLRQRNKERLSSFVQLKDTINKFKEHLDFGNYQIEAQVSFQSNKKVYPRETSSHQSKVLEFEIELNVALFENNDIEF